MGWFIATIREARRQRSADTGGPSQQPIRWTIVLCVIGLGFLIEAGRLVVAGAKGIALAYGVGEFAIGATIVAVGTSMPELATTVIAKLRGHDEVSLGTILGSNIFNGLLIVAVVAVICPIRIDWREVAVALIFGLLAAACTFPARSGLIGRKRGVLLLVLYGLYLAILLQTHSA